MRFEDLRTLSRVSQALWSAKEQSERVLLDTVAATSLLGLEDDRTAERAMISLLDQAERAGDAGNSLANLAVLNQPFYRLTPEERFILVALHEGHWSYLRIARVLGTNPEDVEETAWHARVQVGATLGRYPTGSGQPGKSCPEYDADRPWTQKFFDEQMGNSERVFLQNHLMACGSCREALHRCREIYYAVEKVIPRPEPGQAEADEAAILRAQAQARELVRLKRFPTTWSGTFKVFLKRRDVQIAVIALGFFAVRLIGAVFGY